MTLDKRIADLVAALPSSDQLEFVQLLDAVYSIRFTGPVTIDFLNGVPRQINLGQPVKLAICSATPPRASNPLDTGGGSRAR